MLAALSDKQSSEIEESNGSGYETLLDIDFPSGKYYRPNDKDDRGDAGDGHDGLSKAALVDSQTSPHHYHSTSSPIHHRHSSKPAMPGFVTIIKQNYQTLNTDQRLNMCQTIAIGFTPVVAATALILD